MKSFSCIYNKWISRCWHLKFQFSMAFNWNSINKIAHAIYWNRKYAKRKVCEFLEKNNNIRLCLNAFFFCPNQKWNKRKFANVFDRKNKNISNRNSVMPSFSFVHRDETFLYKFLEMMIICVLFFLFLRSICRRTEHECLYQVYSKTRHPIRLLFFLSSSNQFSNLFLFLFLKCFQYWTILFFCELMQKHGFYAFMISFSLFFCCWFYGWICHMKMHFIEIYSNVIHRVCVYLFLAFPQFHRKKKKIFDKRIRSVFSKNEKINSFENENCF